MIEITKNKMLIEYIHNYIKENKLKDEVYNQINHIRLFKKDLIPTVIVGARE